MLTIERRRDSYWIYPFTKSYYSKKEKKLIGTCPQLDRAFSDFDYHFKRYALKLNIYDKQNKIFKLPLGVNEKYITRILEANNIYEYEFVDNEYITKSRDVSFNINPKFKPKNDFQENAIRFLLYGDMEHHKMLSLDTSMGKTFCTVYALQNLGKASLIITPNTVLLNQWIERISEYTDSNLSNDAIYIIQGSDSIKRLLKKSKQQIKHHEFFIASTQTLVRYIENGNSLNDLLTHLGVGVKVFDEIHMQYSSNMFIATNSDTEKTFFLTATPDRSSTNDGRIFKLLFSDVPVYGIKTHTINNHYNIRLVNYNTNADDYSIRKCVSKFGFNAIQYFNYLFSSMENKLYIYGIIKEITDTVIENNPTGKVLVLIPKLCYILELKKFFDGSYNIGNYTTAVDKKYKRIQLDKQLIFSTLGSSGAGLDLNNLTAVINLTPFSSHVIARQILGRLRPLKDKEVYYYDCIDLSFKNMIYQREKRMEIFKIRAKTIKEKTFTLESVKKYFNK